MAKIFRRFSEYSAREQGLILITGLVVIVLIIFTAFVDPTLAETKNITLKSKSLVSDNKSTQSSILIFEESLNLDPNQILNKQITAYEQKVKQIDDKLLLLTSTLIDPIQMRFALLDMLKVQKGVSLVAFELLGAKPLIDANTSIETNKNNEKDKVNVKTVKADVQSSVNLYQHSVRLTLTGKYFELRDYLTQLEAMPWKFFWKEFKYKVHKYPLGELEIEVYSLSTDEEFIGV